MRDASCCGQATSRRCASIFLENRWLPPGLRLIGLPIAAGFWDKAPTALRIAAAVLTLLPIPVI